MSVFLGRLLVALTLLSCNSQAEMQEGNYDNLEKFDKAVSHLHTTIGAKYGIRDYAFDVECIYQKEDLSRLVKDMLDLGQFRYSLIKDGHDNAKSQYYSVFKVAGKSYEFRTSSAGDYVDLETILPGLEQITRDNRPDHEYRQSNMNGGQIAFLIFARQSDLIAAVNEGYPCSIASGEWPWDEQWPWGVYSDLRLQKSPDLPGLKLKYFQTLQELCRQGYDVPDLTLNRIYIDDIFRESNIDVVIDGSPMPNTSAEVIQGKTVRCMWESWGVLLAYTLVKHYHGQPALYDKSTGTTTTLTPQQYLAKAETAFGIRH